MSGGAADGSWSAAMAKWTPLIADRFVTKYDIEHEEPVMVDWSGRRHCSACGTELVPLQLVCIARESLDRA